ncbi:uncharacterized protein DUF1648 [Asanoa ferruginea]|uniref:Uncharacterized protein DUF1648 n=1 Tax=Asanoa ferruginea TaxID=53367 RepID=A0A3D9ZNW8_9ACTN|nr:DUF1648 domain-containing protein [Asanoa ferruginea]REF99068.1 uncharacterized protein DUF1648 [Asanoa ferruginea]GIF51368.1 hypothetical protein Afe04nite_59070 [Asanoa ferruginea]
MTPRLRAALAAIASWVPAGVLLASPPGRWHDLPATVATHWGTSGRPNGFTGTNTTWTVTLAATLLAGAVAIAAAATAKRFGLGSRLLLGAAGGVGGAAAGLWLVIAAATAGAGSAADARLGWGLVWFFLGLAYGIPVYALAGPQPATREPFESVTPDAMPLGPTQQAAWTTVLRSPLLIGAAAAALLVGALATATIAPRPWTWAILVIPAAVLLTLAEVRVSADRRGLRLTAGLLRLPFKRIPLHRIARASVEHIDPLRWGGWGYRIVVPDRSAFVTRSGPGLVLDLTNGHRFAVTVADPEVPAALLNALRDREPVDM